MSSFRENNDEDDEKDTSTLLRPSPPSSLTSETFEQYVQTLESSLTESKDKLANLLTPEAKREEILQIQKEVRARNPSRNPTELTLTGPFQPKTTTTHSA